VLGIRLEEDQTVISLIIASDGTILNTTENGYGKRTRLAEFTQHKRGGKGMIAIQTSQRNGAVVGATLVNDTDEIMIITSGGILVRTKVDEISIVGRNTQGVRVIRLDKKEKVVGVDRVDGLPDDDEIDEDAVVDDDIATADDNTLASDEDITAAPNNQEDNSGEEE
jgi:DNA gyrase subunit A